MLTPVPSLRTAALCCRLQPSFLSCCSVHNTTATPHSQEFTISKPSHYRRRVALTRGFKTSKKTPQIICRFASNVSTSPSTSTPTSESTSTTSTDPALNWNTFFKLRQSRRWYQLGSSVTTSAAGFVVGTQIMTHTNVEPILSQIPLDPFLTMGLLTFACAGLGWLGGPFVGTAMFNVRNRKYKKQIEEKEVEFYRRIKKWRVDPSGGSIANPVPDYYGEKIGSVLGYRQWLKDQRAFNRKRQNFV